jgi:hypothetical protein
MSEFRLRGSTAGGTGMGSPEVEATVGNLIRLLIVTIAPGLSRILGGFPHANEKARVQNPGLQRVIYSDDQRTTRALPPPMTFSTSLAVTIEVSPGVVMAKAPWAAP